MSQSHIDDKEVEMQVPQNIEEATIEMPRESSQSNSEGEKNQQKGKKGKKAKPPRKEGDGSGTGRSRSYVWNTFVRFTTPDGVIKSRCIHCSQEYMAHSSKNGTTGMRTHIPKCPKDPKNLKNQTIMFQKLENENGISSGVLKTWKFDQEYIRKALITMIIVDELPFSFVEKEGFKDFVEAACPSFHIPSRYTISRDCAQLFLDEKMKLKFFFKKTKQRVCLTTDTWTSNQNVNYMCLTSHFIDDDWTLHKRIINFTPIFNHKGEEIGRAIEKCLREWEIENVMTITVDNASSNDTAISYLRRRLDNNVLDGKFLHMRCVAHIINLVVKDGLKEQDVSVTRVRSAVRFVRQYPSRLHKFKECIKDCNINIKSLLSLDCVTRWNSTYEMLEIAEKFEKAFALYEIRDPTFKHDLEDTCGVPLRSDWQNVRKFVNFLEIFYKLTKNISDSLYVTSNLFFDEIVDVDVHLRECAKSTDVGMRVMAIKMREKYDKYWGKIEKMNMLLYVAVVLDPRHKLEYLEFSFENLYSIEGVNDVGVEFGQSSDCLWKKMSEAVRTTTIELFNEYKGKFGVPQSNLNDHASSVGERNYKNKELFKMRKLEGGIAETKTELDRYLNEECDDDVDEFDILVWWKNNSARFPILSRMAKDVLAIPISTVASESAFSTGGRVLDQFRSSLTPTIVEALICTQD